ncbi:MAG: Phosphoheptose isomerase [Legionellaceae bacterium]
MKVLDKIQQQFALHTESFFTSAELLPRAIEHASDVISQILLAGNKIMTCGNASDGLLAQYFASGLLNRFNKERPNLPAFSLTADNTTLSSITCLYGYEHIFAKQIRTFGEEGDVLFIIASQYANNLKLAITAAQNKKMRVVCLLGQNHIELVTLLQEADIAIIAPCETTELIAEIHFHVIHTLFATLDYQLFAIET